jgi:hypothetical protein
MYYVVIFSFPHFTHKQSVQYNGVAKGGSTSECTDGYGMEPNGAHLEATCSWSEPGGSVTTKLNGRIEHNLPTSTSSDSPPSQPAWTKSADSPGDCVALADCPTDDPTIHAKFPPSQVVGAEGRCTEDIPIKGCDPGYLPAPPTGSVTAKCCYTQGITTWTLSSQAKCGVAIKCTYQITRVFACLG